jgi:hypothetical protein
MKTKLLMWLGSLVVKYDYFLCINSFNRLMGFVLDILQEVYETFTENPPVVTEEAILHLAALIGDSTFFLKNSTWCSFLLFLCR